MKKASVVILTYSHPQNVGAIVDALRDQDCEIIVAEDGLGLFSPDKFNVPVKVYTHERTVPRRATTRNGGVGLATTNNLIFLDDDVLPSPWLVEEHCRALENMDASIGSLTAHGWDIERCMRFKRVRYVIPPNMTLRDMFWTGNLAVRKDVFEELGGLDPRYDGEYGYEDTDFGQNLIRHFKRIYWNPEAVARNLDPPGQWAHSEGETNKRQIEHKWSSPRSYPNERVLVVLPGFAFGPLEWAQGFSRALCHRGFEMRLFDFNFLVETLDDRFRPNVKTRSAEIYKLASDQLGPAVMQSKPDWVLIFEGLRIHEETWKLLQDLPVRVGLVLTESSARDEIQLKFAHYADKVFCNERDSVEFYENGAYLPASYDKFVHRARRPTDRFACDAILAMHGSEERREFVSEMDWNGVDMRLIGEWRFQYGHRLYIHQETNAVANEELSRWYNSAKLGLNIYRAAGGSSLNPRAYEMAACGCFQVATPRAENDLFGDSIAVAESPFRAERLIRYYLAHPDERRDMVEEAMRRIRNCSFDDRVEILIRDMRGE